MGTPFALDFGAIMMMGQAQGVDVEMLAAVLPEVEQAVISGIGDDDADTKEE
jgi:hypothetical protein